MKCPACESTEFSEENGKLYCNYCQIEIPGYTIKLSDTKNFRFGLTREIRIKTEPKKELKHNYSWNTTEAFNKILIKQFKCISEIEGIGISFDNLNVLLQSVWFTYLDKTELSLNKDNKSVASLHSVTRIRDKNYSNNSKRNIDTDLGEGTLVEETSRINLITDEQMSENESQFQIEDYYESESDHFEENIDYECDQNEIESVPKKRSLSDLRRSRNISHKDSIHVMNLPKTLAIINIAIRFAKKCEIQVSDLIRWSIERNIPYIYCFECLPKVWSLEKESNDWHTFTSTVCPSAKTINELSAQIAKLIQIKDFPNFDFQSLIRRYAFDLRIPGDIADIIDKHYNLIENFPKQLKIFGYKSFFPHFDRWVLMTIVMVLKRLLVLNDKYEYDLSRIAEKVKRKKLFDWKKWENYTILRLKVIKTHFMPSFGQNIELIQSSELIGNHYSKRTKSEQEVRAGFRPKFNDKELRKNIEHSFLRLSQQLGYESKIIEQIRPSMFPLINATDFALQIINCENTSKKLKTYEKRFENKTLLPYVCYHQMSAQRPYYALNMKNASKPQNIEKWSKSFKLLIELSCFILNCNQQDLYPIIIQIENKFFINEIDIIQENQSSD